MTLTILIILMIVIQPFKEDKSHHSIINTMFIIVFAIASSNILGDDRAVFKKITRMSFFTYFGLAVATTPLLYMTVVVLYWAWRQRELVSGIIRRVCALRSGYEPLE